MNLIVATAVALINHCHQLLLEVRWGEVQMVNGQAMDLQTGLGKMGEIHDTHLALQEAIRLALAHPALLAITTESLKQPTMDVVHHLHLHASNPGNQMAHEFHAMHRRFERPITSLFLHRKD